MRNCKSVFAVVVFFAGLFLCVFMFKVYAQDYAQQNSVRLQMPPDNEQADANADTQATGNSITDNSADNGQTSNDEAGPVEQSSGSGASENTNAIQ